jgi:ribose/xylose/arabinose/galactoside ABC-type transport system permease subunit
VTSDASRRAHGVTPALAAALTIGFALLVNAWLTPGFFSPAALSSVVVQSVTTLLVGVGMTLVMATGGIDLSVGSLMAASSAVAVTLLPEGVSTAFGGALLLSLLAGAANGVLVARYRLLPFVVTLAALMIWRGVAQVIVAGSPLVVFSNATFERLGRGHLGPVPIQVVVAAIAVGGFALLVRSTLWGRYLVAIGGNERASFLSGVPVSTLKVVVYAASGLLAGLAGLIETARLAAADASTIGSGAELDGIVAAVVGGTPLSGGRANIGGTALGALLMSAINVSFAMHLVRPAWSLLFKALLLLVIVWAQRRRGG